MNSIRRKLRSQKGASITFALLLFLVCAIVSGIVVVAATAVGGRASKMAEMDQRYYAVNSAAELLRDVLQDQTVVVKTGTKTVSTVDQDGKYLQKPKQKTENGTPVVDDDTGDPVYELDAEGNTVYEDDTGTQTSIPNEISVNGVKTTDVSPLLTSAAQILAGIEGAALPADLLSLAVASGITDPTTIAALAVTLTPTIDATTRRLYIDVSNTTKTNGAYTLRLTFKADITQDNGERTTYTAPMPTVDGDGKIIEGKYTRQKTVEKTTVSTIRWKMIDLQTVVASVTTS